MQSSNIILKITLTDHVPDEYHIQQPVGAGTNWQVSADSATSSLCVQSLI
jgi:hypothetical protein